MYDRQPTRSGTAPPVPIGSPRPSGSPRQRLGTPPVDDAAKNSGPEPVWTRVDVWRELRPLQEEVNKLRTELKKVQSDKTLGTEATDKKLKDEESQLFRMQDALRFETDEVSILSNALEETRTEAAKESATAYKGRAEGVQAANMVRTSRAKVKDEESNLSRLRSELEEQERACHVAKHWAAEKSKEANMANARASQECVSVRFLRSELTSERDIANLANEKEAKQHEDFSHLESEFSLVDTSAQKANVEIQELLRARNGLQTTLESFREKFKLSTEIAQNMKDALAKGESDVESEAMMATNLKHALTSTQTELTQELEVARARAESNLTQEQEAVLQSESELVFESTFAREESALVKAERHEIATERQTVREMTDALRHVGEELSVEAATSHSEARLVSDARAELTEESSTAQSRRVLALAAESETAMTESVLSSMIATAKLEDEEMIKVRGRVETLRAELEEEIDATRIEREHSQAAKRGATSEETAVSLATSKLEHQRQELSDRAQQVHNLRSEFFEEMEALKAEEEVVRISKLDAACRENASSAMWTEAKREQEALTQEAQRLRDELMTAGNGARSDSEMRYQLTEQLQCLRNELVEERGMASAQRDAVCVIQSKLAAEESNAEELSSKLTSRSLVGGEHEQEVVALHRRLEDEAAHIRRLSLEVQEHAEQTMSRSAHDACSNPRFSIKDAWSFDGAVAGREEAESSDRVSDEASLSCARPDSSPLDAAFLRTQLTWEQDSRAAQTKEIMLLQHRIKELEDMVAGFRSGTSSSLPLPRAPSRNLDVDRATTPGGLNISPNGGQILPPLPPRQTPPSPCEDQRSSGDSNSAGHVAFSRMRRSLSNVSHDDKKGNNSGGRQCREAPKSPAPIRARSPAAWASPRARSPRQYWNA